MNKIQIRLSKEETIERCRMIRNLNNIVTIGEPIKDDIVDALIDLEFGLAKKEMYHLSACVRDFTFEYVSES